jgi:ribosomal protein S4E
MAANRRVLHESPKLHFLVEESIVILLRGEADRIVIRVDGLHVNHAGEIAASDIRRRIANCFVAVESASGNVAAYYTISSAGIPFSDLPPG